MARDALGKLQEARELDALADGLQKRDPGAARRIQMLANKKRQTAIKQMGRRPKRKKAPAPGMRR